jgi:hypothetical protein
MRLLASTDGLRALDKSTPVRPRLGAQWELEVSEFDVPQPGPTSGDGATITLSGRDRTLTLPAFVAPSVRLLLSAPRTANEIADASEGVLSVDDALVLVRRLVREGVLVTLD